MAINREEINVLMRMNIYHSKEDIITQVLLAGCDSIGYLIKEV